MVKTISSRSSSRVSEQVDDQGMRDGKGVHTIRDSCYHKQERAEKTWRGGGMAANTSMVRQIINFKNLHHLGSFAPLGGERRGPMPLGLFLLFFWWSLAQTSARSKQYLPVIFVLLAFIGQVGVENYWRFNGIKTLR